MKFKGELMKLLDEYFELQERVFEYFGYKEDWRVIPLDDATGYWWRIIGGEGHGGSVQFSNRKEELGTGEHYYEDEIYTQRFLPKWVYRGKDYTMICVDTHTDGNKLLRVFDNTKEVK
jgi:hypothetical protein